MSNHSYRLLRTRLRGAVEACICKALPSTHSAKAGMIKLVWAPTAQQLQDTDATLPLLVMEGELAMQKGHVQCRSGPRSYCLMLLDKAEALSEYREFILML